MSKLPVIIAEHVSYYDINELCKVSTVEKQFVVQLVEHGILDPKGREESEWQFAQTQLRMVRKAAALKRDLHVNVPGIGLILQLLEELEQLRSERERDFWA